MTNATRSRGKLRFFAMALMGIVGCGGPTLYQVQGTVVYKDEADVSVLAKGLVIFEPVNPEVKVSVRGEIKPDGSFRMSTFHDGDGVIPGEYRVLVSAPIFLGGRNAPRPQLLDPDFEDFATSGLHITVTKPVTDFVITVDKQH